MDGVSVHCKSNTFESKNKIETSCTCTALHTLLGFTKALEREDTERAARFFQPMLPLEPVFTFAPELHQDLDGSDTHQGLLVLWEKLGGGEI